MKRRAFLLGFSSLALSGSAAAAAGYEADIVAQLRALGFDTIMVSTTWLGRTRITARKNGSGREIVINPRTGEILRDIVIQPDGSASPRISEGAQPSSGSQSGSDTENSGSGSDSSGSGSSGSGSSGDSNSSGEREGSNTESHSGSGSEHESNSGSEH